MYHKQAARSIAPRSRMANNLLDPNTAKKGGDLVRYHKQRDAKAPAMALKCNLSSLIDKEKG